MANNFDNLAPEKITVGWPWRLFVFSLIAFGVFLASYFGLRFGYGTYLASQIDKKDQEITALAQSVPQEEQQALLKFYTQLTNLQEILGNHVLGSRIYPFLEGSTNQSVYYLTFTLSVPEKKLVLEGIARSYAVLAQQLEAFKQIPEIRRFLISQADADPKDGTVRFRVALFLNPAIFH